MHKTAIAQRARVLALVALILMAGSVLVCGCVTANKVRAIVDESNTLLVSEQLLAPDPSPDGVTAEWQATAQKIDAFIAAHPDQEATNGALRIRQAFLYLNNKKFNMATAAFIDAGKFSAKLNSRDAALLDFSDDIIWWFEKSNDDSFQWTNGENWKIAQGHLDKFKDVLAEDKKYNQGVKDYLLEMRMYIALKMMTKQFNTDFKTDVFRSGLVEYARIFEPDDMTALQNIYKGVTGNQKLRVRAEDLNFCSNEKCDSKKDPWANIRRRARAVTVIETAAEFVKRAWPTSDGQSYNPNNFNPDFSGDSNEVQKLWRIVFKRAKQMAGIE